MPLREEVIPIHDIRIRFCGAYDLRSVHLEPGGFQLEPRPVDGGVDVVVPRIDVHAMVVVELGG